MESLGETVIRNERLGQEEVYEGKCALVWGTGDVFNIFFNEPGGVVSLMTCS